MTNNVYVLDVGKNNWIGSTKEEILSMIEQMFDEGNLPNIDDGFITKIKEANKGNNTSVWIGARPEYELISVRDNNTLYLIVDDSQNDYKTKINEIRDNISTIDRLNRDTESIYSGLRNGEIETPIATYAEGTSENANRTIEVRLAHAGDNLTYTSYNVAVITSDQSFTRKPTFLMTFDVRGKEVICSITIENLYEDIQNDISVSAYFLNKIASPLNIVPKDEVTIYLTWYSRGTTIAPEYENIVEIGKIERYFDTEYQEWGGRFSLKTIQLEANPNTRGAHFYRLYGIAKYETE